MFANNIAIDAGCELRVLLTCQRLQVIIWKQRVARAAVRGPGNRYISEYRRSIA